MSYILHTPDEKQCYLYSLPEGDLYTVESLDENTGKFLPYQAPFCNQLMTLEEARKILEDMESGRICKLSRYLSRGELVYTEIYRFKYKGGTVS